MNTKIKTFFFILLLILLLLPVFQEFTQYFNEPVLHGAFVKPDKPKFTWKSLKSNLFQKDFENYLNNDFGFRGLMIKIKNSWEYILFNKINVPDQVEGKAGVIFSRSSIESTIGSSYNGSNKNEQTISKVNFLKEWIERNGGHFLAIMTPSKEIILPEYLPESYKGFSIDSSNYKDFIKDFKKYNIPFIDFCSYFIEQRKTCTYPIFTKTGFHWSSCAASVAQDSLLKYIQQFLLEPMPSYVRNGVEWSDTARDSEADFEEPMNLLHSISQKRYVYPRLEMVQSSLKNPRPKVIIIGDSFFWQIANLRKLEHIFSEDSRYWYYFSQSVPLGSMDGTFIKNVDVIKELKSADFVLLVGSFGTMSIFPYGVTDYYYEKANKPQLLASIQENIRKNKNWIDSLQTKSKSKGISIEKLISEEAICISRDRLIVQIKAFNNKFVSSDASKGNIVIADRDKAQAWETFNIIGLKNSKCIITSYADKFFSADIGGKYDITAKKEKAQEWEIFTIKNIDKTHVAFQAANGNYLSVDDKTFQVFAKSKSVGTLEKFELIVK